MNQKQRGILKKILPRNVDNSTRNREGHVVIEGLAFGNSIYYWCVRCQSEHKVCRHASMALHQYHQTCPRDVSEIIFVRYFYEITFESFEKYKIKHLHKYDYIECIDLKTGKETVCVSLYQTS